MRKFVRWAALGAVVLALSGCHHDGPAPLSPAAPAAPQVPRDSAVVYVVNPKATGDQDTLMPRTVALHRSASPARDAVDALLRAKGSPLPAGTALRGLTVDGGGVATLDFSQSPISDTGGEGAQGDALAALARTLGQFPEIKQYQIQVKGEAVKSLGEQGAVDGPMDVIRPAALPPTNGAAQ